MATFHVLEELPQEAQDKINHILSIPVGQRTSTETAYLNARADYLDNRILERDTDGNILRASGLLVPVDGLSGFAKGAMFIERDAIGGVAATYENRGTTASSDFNLIGGTANSVFTTVGPIGSGAIYETSSHAGIQDAADLLGAAGGGKILLKNGNYNATSSPSLKSNVTLVGEGYGTRINLAAGTSLSFFNVNHANVEHLRVDATAHSGTSMFGIFVENSTYCTIDDVDVDAGSFGVFIVASTATPSRLTDHILLNNSRISNNGNQDTVGGGPADSTGSVCSNVTVRDCVVKNTITSAGSGAPGSGQYRSAFDMVAVKGIKVRDSTFYGTIEFGFEQDYSRDSSFIGNNVYPAINDNDTQIAIKNQSSSTVSPRRCIVALNHVFSGRIYIKGTAAGKAKNILVSLNTTIAATTSPVNAQHGIVFEHCSGCTAIGNALVGNGSGNAGFYLDSCDNINMNGGNHVDGFAYAAQSVSYDGSSSFCNNTMVNIVNAAKVLNIANAPNNMGMNPNVLTDKGNITGAVTISPISGDTQRMTLTGNVTFTINNGLVEGQELTLILIQDATGGRTATWPSNFKKAGGALTLSTGANAIDTVTMKYSNTAWREVARAMNQS